MSADKIVRRFRIVDDEEPINTKIVPRRIRDDGESTGRHRVVRPRPSMVWDPSEPVPPSS